VILPHVAAYNAGAAPTALRRVAHALGAKEAAGALFDLAARHGAPTSLRQLGMSESDLDKATDAALQAAYWNPRPVARGPIRALLDDAYHGRRPSGAGA
jgi:alcohol dehydrogenase class IV